MDPFEGFAQAGMTQFPQLPPATGSELVIKANGEVWIDEKHTQQWMPCVYHDAIRHELLDTTDILAFNMGGYKHPRAGGIAPNDLDRTSFHPLHQDWGEDREDRPPILFQIAKGPRDVGKTAGTWIYEDQYVVLGRDGDVPLKRYLDIPVTLSTQLEGWLLEAMMRCNPLISVRRDIIPRMLKVDGQVVPYNRLTTRRKHFRETVGLLAWDGKQWKNNIENVYWSIVPEWCRAQNSLQDWRDFKNSEHQRLKGANAGIKKRHLEDQDDAALESMRFKEEDQEDEY